MTQKQGDKAFLAVHLLVDCSGSMGEFTPSMRESIKNFIETLQGSYAPPSFALTAYESFTHPLISARPVNEVGPVAAADGYRTGGGTNTSLAVLEALASLKRVSAEKKVLVIQTDGDDGGFHHHLAAKEAVAKAQADGWTIIAITMGDIMAEAFADYFGINRDMAMDFKPTKLVECMRAACALALRAGDPDPAFTDEERKRCR